MLPFSFRPASLYEQLYLTPLEHFPIWLVLNTNTFILDLESFLFYYLYFWTYTENLFQNFKT